MRSFLELCGNRNSKRAQNLNGRLITENQQSTSVRTLILKKVFINISKATVSAFAIWALAMPQGSFAFSLSESLWPFSKTYSLSEIKKEKFSASLQENILSDNNFLLSSPTNPNPKKAIGGGALPLDKDYALLAEADFYTDSSPENIEGKIKVYTVKKGDTLYSIAKKYGVSVNTIRWANDIDKKGTIKPGQELVILPVNGVRYTVKRGGSLRDIVKKIGGDLDAAVELNGFEADEELKKGTVVIIPGAVVKEKPSATRKSYAYTKVYNKNIKGYFARPLYHYVRTQGLHGKNAVDMAAPVGTPIHASASGRVIIARYGWNGGYGNYIVIQHPNGTQTLYSHASKLFVIKGQWVNQGDIIAAVGSTGRSTGPHLHFEVRGARNPF